MTVPSLIFTRKQHTSSIQLFCLIWINIHAATRSWPRSVDHAPATPPSGFTRKHSGTFHRNWFEKCETLTCSTQTAFPRNSSTVIPSPRSYPLALFGYDYLDIKERKKNNLNQRNNRIHTRSDKSSKLSVPALINALKTVAIDFTIVDYKCFHFVFRKRLGKRRERGTKICSGKYIYHSFSKRDFTRASCSPRRPAHTWRLLCIFAPNLTVLIFIFRKDISYRSGRAESFMGDESKRAP